MSADYFSYVEWRQKPFVGQTINIDPEYSIRKTPITLSRDMGKRTYFFGGSTMWGWGADDSHTIPAQFQALMGGEVLNFGEHGWVAHQSFNQLMKLYGGGHRPDEVIFYEGANEVANKCRTENDFWAHPREDRIRRAVATKPFRFTYYIEPLLALGRLAKSDLRKYLQRSAPAFNCDSDSTKADRIAEQLVNDWTLAKAIVDLYGGRFHAYLQPVAL